MLERLHVTRFMVQHDLHAAGGLSRGVLGDKDMQN